MKDKMREEIMTIKDDYVNSRDWNPEIDSSLMRTGR